MRQTVAILGVIVVILLAIALYAGVTLPRADVVTPTGEAVVYIDNLPIQVLVADTVATRTKGLSGHPPLGENEGMLFVFEEADRYGFWMKDMRFAIDILWLSAEGFVVDIDERVGPESYPTVFKPDSPAMFVLEVPAGFVQRHSIVRGSKLSF